MSDEKAAFGSFIDNPGGASINTALPIASGGLPVVSDEQALTSGEAATLGRIGSLLDGVISEEAGEPSEGNGEPSVDPRLTEARSLTQALINSSSY